MLKQLLFVSASFALLSLGFFFTQVRRTSAELPALTQATIKAEFQATRDLASAKFDMLDKRVDALATMVDARAGKLQADTFAEAIEWRKDTVALAQGIRDDGLKLLDSRSAEALRIVDQRSGDAVGAVNEAVKLTGEKVDSAVAQAATLNAQLQPVLSHTRNIVRQFDEAAPLWLDCDHNPDCAFNRYQGFSKAVERQSIDISHIIHVIDARYFQPRTKKQAVWDTAKDVLRIGGAVAR